MMKWLKYFSPLVAALLLSACVTTGAGKIDTNNPEYQKGFALGEQTANQDKNRINCANGAFGLTWAKKRMSEPAVAGQSELFKSGFYRGYTDTWNENMGQLCES